MLIVRKYGGTSVGSAARIAAVAGQVTELAGQGHQVAVVVSAMGDTTDRLLDLAREIAPTPDARELDALLATGEMVSTALLAMALRGDIVACDEGALKQAGAVGWTGDPEGSSGGTLRPWSWRGWPW